MGVVDTKSGATRRIQPIAGQDGQDGKDGVSSRVCVNLRLVAAVIGLVADQFVAPYPCQVVGVRTYTPLSSPPSVVYRKNGSVVAAPTPAAPVSLAAGDRFGAEAAFIALQLGRIDVSLIVVETGT